MLSHVRGGTHNNTGSGPACISKPSRGHRVPAWISKDPVGSNASFTASDVSLMGGYRSDSCNGTWACVNRGHPIGWRAACLAGPAYRLVFSAFIRTVLHHWMNPP